MIGSTGFGSVAGRILRVGRVSDGSGQPYLRLTMSQERLSGLAILSIENEILEEFEYKNLITQFAF